MSHTSVSRDEKAGAQWVTDYIGQMGLLGQSIWMGHPLTHD